MQYLLITVCIFCLSRDIYAQVDTLVNESNSSNAPQTNIKVDKEYDPEGNLIRYDSTYSYYYSSNDTVSNQDALNIDSVFFNSWGSPLDIWNDFDLQFEEMRKMQEQMMDLFYGQQDIMTPHSSEKPQEKPHRNDSY